MHQSGSGRDECGGRHDRRDGGLHQLDVGAADPGQLGECGAAVSAAAPQSDATLVSTVQSVSRCESDRRVAPFFVGAALARESGAHGDRLVVGLPAVLQRHNSGRSA